MLLDSEEEKVCLTVCRKITPKGDFPLTSKDVGLNIHVTKVNKIKINIGRRSRATRVRRYLVSSVCVTTRQGDTYECIVP